MRNARGTSGFDLIGERAARNDEIRNSNDERNPNDPTPKATRRILVIGYLSIHRVVPVAHICVIIRSCRQGVSWLRDHRWPKN